MVVCDGVSGEVDVGNDDEVTALVFDAGVGEAEGGDELLDFVLGQCS